MISITSVLEIHQTLIEHFGGSHGLRDQGALEAALARPYATFGGEDLYVSPIHKAAAILQSISINHPFIDGNKRTAYVLMRLILLENGYDINANEDEKYNLVIRVASGELEVEDIVRELNPIITKA